MRKIYESRAVERDDENPFEPGKLDRGVKPRAMRTVSGGLLSRLLLPAWVRHRGLSVSVSTPETTYEPGEVVPFTVTIANRLPVPVTVRTATPVLWTWDIDGLREASQVVEELPDREATFQFDRGERKRFRRRWHQLFQVSDAEWEDAEPGEYTISARLTLGAHGGRSATTTIRIE